MCGIVGFLAGGTNVAGNSNRSDFMEQGIYADALRGFHSTGVYAVEGNYDVWWMKDNVEARHFLQQKRVDRELGSVGYGTRICVGHNRYATVGKLTVDNAHPYHMEHITLVHNGSLASYHNLPKHPEADTDSSRICAAFNTADATAAHRKKVLEDLDGAFALAWFDSRDMSFHIVRNEERPMSYIHLDNDQLFFASEGAMLAWLVYRNNISAKLCTATGFEPNVLNSWAADEKGGLSTDKVERTRFRPKPAKTYGGWNYHTNSATTPYVHDTSTVDVDTSEDAATPNLKDLLTTKREEKVNAELKAKGILISVGDTIEVMAGGVLPYRSKTGQPLARGCDRGWFENDVFDCLVNSDYKGHLFADVHNTPVLADASGLEIDSYLVHVKGLKKLEAIDCVSSTANDNILLAQHSSYLAHKHFTTEFQNTTLDEFFDGKRWKYSVSDQPLKEHPHYGVKLTRREVDEFTMGKKCGGCKIGAELVPTNNIMFTQNRKQGFLCSDCFKKAA